MPTLLDKKNLVAPNGDDAALQAILDKYRPIDFVLEWFKRNDGKSTPDGRVLALVAKTASGKSTVFPAELFINAVKDTRGGSIICTQPRILTAITIPLQIKEFYESRGIILGENMGYSTKTIKLQSKHKGLTFATIGTLLAQLQTMGDNEIMDMYRYIIIDEAHERSLTADMTLAALKALIWRNSGNRRCPFVIVTSATIDPKRYATYFLSAPPGFSASMRPRVSSAEDPFDTNVIICTGFSFPREIFFLEKDAENVTDSIVECLDNIRNKFPPPDYMRPNPATGQFERERDDILVFLPGKAEISELEKKILEHNIKTRAPRHLMPVPLTSNDVKREHASYKAISEWMKNFKEAGLIERRVILSTNVAETGLTLDTLRYVIDAGFNNENEYNPRYGASALIAKPAPKSRITQRIGRVGRKFPGSFYAMYTKETWSALLDDQYPEVCTSNLTPIIVPLIFDQQRTKESLNGDPYFVASDLDLPDRPSEEALTDGLEHAHALGYIAVNPPQFKFEIEAFRELRPSGRADAVGITGIGRILIDCGSTISSPEALRMILAGAAWGYRMIDLIDIAAYLQSPQLKREPVDSKEIVAINSGSFYADIFGAPQAISAWHTLLADTFFDGAVICAAIDAFFDRKHEDYSAEFADWCHSRGLDHRGICDLIDIRSEMRSAILNQGFDIFAGDSLFAHQEPHALAAAAKKYKHCIHDGYRMNTIYGSAPAGRIMYETRTGLTVSTQAINAAVGILPDKVASVLICSDFMSRVSRKTGSLEITPSAISILDGFIGDDQLFTR